MADTKTQKPHKWNKRKDASHCIECDTAFKTGDMVFTDCAVNLHATCLKRYKETCLKLFGPVFRPQEPPR